MKREKSTLSHPPNLPVDLGAAVALRYLEDAAREAETDEPLIVTIQRARDRLWAQMDASYPRAKK